MRNLITWLRGRPAQGMDRRITEPIPTRPAGASELESLQCDVDALQRLVRLGETEWGYARLASDRNLVGMPISHADSAAAPGVLVWERQGGVLGYLQTLRFKLGQELLKVDRVADADAVLSDARQLDLAMVTKRKNEMPHDPFAGVVWSSEEAGRRARAELAQRFPVVAADDDPSDDEQGYLFIGIWQCSFEAAIALRDMDTATSILGTLAGTASSGDASNRPSGWPPDRLVSLSGCIQRALRRAVAARDMAMVRSVADAVSGNACALEQLPAGIEDAKAKYHSRKARKAGAVAFADELDEWLKERAPADASGSSKGENVRG